MVAMIIMKVTMVILMTKLLKKHTIIVNFDYKMAILGTINWSKRANKFGHGYYPLGRPPLPPFGKCPKRKVFSTDVFPKKYIQTVDCQL